MNSCLYKIECLTNMHVGSGDVSYNIIDKEVQKDPILKNVPIISSSGVKGAYREHFTNMKIGNVEDIFGQAPKLTEEEMRTGKKIKPGKYKFFSANLLTRPLRVSEERSYISYINVTTVEILRNFIDLCKNLNVNLNINININININDLLEGVSNHPFLTSLSNIEIEGHNAKALDSSILTNLEGFFRLFKITDFAITSSFEDYDLPVIARNHLENGQSSNLWYEEFVPYKSVFYLFILSPEKEEVDFSGLIQFGGNATIGYGLTKVTKIAPNGTSEDKANE